MGGFSAKPYRGLRHWRKSQETITCATKKKSRLTCPDERVIELFDSFENLKQWQEGLEEIEHLSGESGQPGAKTRLVYNMGKRKMEMIETILTRNMPDEFSGTYDAPGVHNIVRNTFHDQGRADTLAHGLRIPVPQLYAYHGFLHGAGALPQADAQGHGVLQALCRECLSRATESAA